MGRLAGDRGVGWSVGAIGAAVAALVPAAVALMLPAAAAWNAAVAADDEPPGSAAPSGPPLPRPADQAPPAARARPAVELEKPAQIAGAPPTPVVRVVGPAVRLAPPAEPEPVGGRPRPVAQTGHTQPVGSVAFSRDGRRIVTGSSDGTAIIWDAATGRSIRKLPGQH